MTVRATLCMLALVLVELGCKPACEEAGLRRAAEAFAGPSRVRRQDGFEALEQACPTLPPTLGRSLVMEFDALGVDPSLAIFSDRRNDPAWRELLDHTCPRTGEAGEVVEAEESALATRTRCTLDRYGLLAPEDVFIRRDLTVFMLYEWLVAGRVERGLAQDVVRPLLAVSASVEQLEAMCLHEGLACERVIERWGVEPLRSTIDLPLEGGTVVRISPTELSVAAQGSVLTLDAGRPASDIVVAHAAQSLREVLTNEAGNARDAAHREEIERGERVTFVADPTTPFGTLAYVFSTATNAGYSSAQLVVADEGGLHGLPLRPPRALPAPQPDARIVERPLDLIFTVHRDRVEASCRGIRLVKGFPSRAGCAPSPAGCHDLEELARFSNSMKSLFPHETAVTFRVDDDVPLQTLVTLLDVARGEGCALLKRVHGELDPPECLFYDAIIDTSG